MGQETGLKTSGSIEKKILTNYQSEFLQLSKHNPIQLQTVLVNNLQIDNKAKQKLQQL